MAFSQPGVRTKLQSRVLKGVTRLLLSQLHEACCLVAWAVVAAYLVCLAYH